jgi:UDP-4-amino-4,6-dideoxy-N-acetyl-beta-L-altrosamine N-acetyltransferase
MLQGNKVSLGEFRHEDKEKLFRWINDPDVVQYNSAYRPIGEPEHCAWWSSLNTTDSKRSWAVRSNSDERIIGVVQLMNIDPVHRHAEVSIRIGDQSDRERGAGTEALQLLARAAFEHLNLSRIFTHVWVDNERAVRAYTKAGFEREGTLRSHVFIRGNWKDVLIMGRLRS